MSDNRSRDRMILFIVLSLLAHTIVVVFLMMNPLVDEAKVEQKKTVTVQLKKQAKPIDKKKERKTEAAKKWEEKKKEAQKQKEKKQKAKKQEAKKEEAKKEEAKKQKAKKQKAKKQKAKKQKPKKQKPKKQKPKKQKLKKQKPKKAESTQKKHDKEATGGTSKKPETIKDNTPLIKEFPEPSVKDESKKESLTPEDREKDVKDIQERDQKIKNLTKDEKIKKITKPAALTKKRDVVSTSDTKEQGDKSKVKFGSMKMMDDGEMSDIIVDVKNLAKSFEYRDKEGRRILKNLNITMKKEFTDAMNFAYEQLLVNMVVPAWDGKKYKGEINFYITEKGVINKIVLKTPSGHKGLDDAMISALLKTKKLIMPPEGDVKKVMYLTRKLLFYDESDMPR